MNKIFILISIILIYGCTTKYHPLSYYGKMADRVYSASFNYCTSTQEDNLLCKKYANCVRKSFIKSNDTIESQEAGSSRLMVPIGGFTATYHGKSVSPVAFLQDLQNQNALWSDKDNDSYVAQVFMRIFYDYCGEDVFTLQERCESLAFTGVYPDWCPQGGYEPWKK